MTGIAFAGLEICAPETRRRTSTAVLPALIAFLVGTLPVLAETTSHVAHDGVLRVTITGDGGEARIWVSDGKIWVNGFPPGAPGSPEVDASEITGIVVQGSDGDDNIDLSGIDYGDLPMMPILTGPTVNAGAGDDTVIGSTYDDTVNAGSGDDTVNGGEGVDTINGEGGNDTLSGGQAPDIIHGGDGTDKIDGGDDDDFLYGDAGDDTIAGGDGYDRIYGGQGRDFLEGGDGADVIQGGADQDTMIGGEGLDSMSGGSGSDIITGGKDADHIFGDEGNDVINGGEGRDIILGGDGDDVIAGGPGNDDIDGGKGNNRYVVTPGSTDTLIEDGGDDTLDFSEATAAITLNMDMADEDQTVDAAGNFVHLQGQFEHFTGSAFGDVVAVRALNVPRTIDGGAGTADILNFDSRGADVTDDGTTLTVAGLAPVTYTNFETVNIVDLSDNGDGGVVCPTAAILLMTAGLGGALLCRPRRGSQRDRGAWSCANAGWN